ncbi:MAG: EAL domain-containing protein [Bacterioplanes sp.]|nr:EAL domain-containing protein [Bacterioplanes sp.]
MSNESPAVVSSSALTALSATRLLQVITFTLVGLLVAMWVATGTTQTILFFGCTGLTMASWVAYRGHATAAAFLFLWTITLMLSALAYLSAGIRDLAVLGYPGLLVLAAIVGSGRLLFSLLFFIVGYCSLLAYWAITGVLVPVIPPVEAKHVVFTNVILLVTGFSVFLLFGDVRRLMGSLEAENARVRKTQAAIARLANHDQLTDLPNRRYCEELFVRAQNRSQQQHQRLAVLFLDLDNFKPVNDSLGHSAGDLLLQQLVLRLQSLLRPHDVLCRFGGDEFLLLVATDAHSDDAIMQLSEQLIKKTTKPFFISQMQVEISASIGIAFAPEHGTEFTALCRHADMAMYKAKQDGRNTYRFFHPDLDRINIDKFNMLQSMRQALKDRRFELYYQPKLDIEDGRVIGAEALIRWPQRDGSFIYPDQFIPLAESSGFISELGAWVIQEACAACARWQELGLTEVTVAVNVSYVQFRDGLLEQHVRQALQDSKLAATALELELTESLLIGEGDTIQQQLHSIHQLGCTLAIDDFGTGYSNLGYLRRFNATRLKIDKSFISSLCVSSRDQPLVHAIIQLANSLGLVSVAEGIEDEATLLQLRAMGCNEGQGYYWAKPMPEADFIAYLQKGAAINRADVIPIR